MRRDLLSAYGATAAKILSWVVALGIVYRFIGLAEFALLALVRGTIGILNYTTLGLSPAIIRMISEAQRAEHAVSGPRPPPLPGVAGKNVLSYYRLEAEGGVRSLYANAMTIALVCGIAGIGFSIAYAVVFDTLYEVPPGLSGALVGVVSWMGLGTVLRLMSDAPGSILQSHGEIARDNRLLIEAEVAWIVLTVAGLLIADRQAVGLLLIAAAYVISGSVLLVHRIDYARRITGLLVPRWRLVRKATIRRLLAFGSLVLFAQLADFLYAPTDYILINLLIGWEAVATYTPAMTIDSGLLLLVTGLSSVILPRTAIAHTRGDIARVRRYYIWGTMFSATLLLLAAAIVWLIAEWIFLLWLGQPMRATEAILPLVLVHTIIGGSSAVGRSILLGMGRVTAFTISVLIAGVVNVVLSYVFVRHLNLGLNGIVLGTIVVVVARAGVWMPWYVLWTLRHEARGAGARE